MEPKTLTSQCSFQKESSKSKRTMSKDSHPKSLGSPSPANPTWLNQSPSDQPVKPSCIQHTPTGSKVTETCHSNLINGPTSSDGNSNTQLHSSEPENSSGKKAIPPMQLLNKLKKKCTSTWNSTQKPTLKSWPFRLSRVSRLNPKNSQVDTVLQLLKLGFMRMDVPFKLLPATIWVKTSPRCLV
jgi:hypothetical protein